MVVTDIIAHLLIKATVKKRNIIFVSAVIYGFFLFWFLTMFHKIFHSWLVTSANFLFIGGWFYLDLRYLIKFINSQQEQNRLK